MLRSIDHIVILVRDLDQARADYERLGFTVTPGGTHTGGATHNALITFADGCYFELIAFTQPERDQPHQWYPRLAKGEGLVDYCLASDGLAADADAARGRGLDYAGPNNQGRLRPDGQAIKWRTIRQGKPIGAHAMPFAIEDVTPRGLRVPGGAAAEHSLGVKRVAGLTLVVRDLRETSASLGALLGKEARVTSPMVEGAGAAMMFDLGQQWLELAQPVADDGPFATESELMRYLKHYGEGPFEVVLSGQHIGAPGSGERLTGETHGARLRVVR